MFNIPFRYQLSGNFVGHFGLCQLNDGITLCRKLGLEVKSVILGNEEWNDAMSWSHREINEESKIFHISELFSLDIVRSQNRSELIFVCE